MENEIIMQDAPITKELQASVLESAINSLTEGEINPLEFVTKIKATADTCSAILKDSRTVDAVYNEINKYGKGERPGYGGAKISMRETGVRFDYSACGDPIWNDLNAQMAKLKEAMKSREDFLQHIEAGKNINIVIEDTGEMAQVWGPVKSSTTSFAITFAKK